MAKKIAKLLKTDVMADIDMPGIAQFLQSQGRRGDSILAHINPKEAMLLQSMGGAATSNPVSGLPEFYQEDFEPVDINDLVTESRFERLRNPPQVSSYQETEPNTNIFRQEYSQPRQAPPNAPPLVNMPDPDGSPADGSFSFSTGRNNLSGYLEYDPRRLSREPMFTGAGNLDAPVIETQFDPRMGFGGAGETSAAYRAANYGGGLPPRSFAANLNRPPIPEYDLSGISYNDAIGEAAASGVPAPESPGIVRRSIEGLKDFTGLSGSDLARLGLAAGLGIQGSMGARDAAEQGRQARAEQEEIARPYRERGAELLAQAEGGQLTPQAQQSLQAMRARLAQGIESRGGVGVQQAQAQIENYRQQLIANQYDYGMKISNVGDQLMLGAIRTGLEADRYATQMTNNYYTNMARILVGMGTDENEIRQIAQPGVTGGK